MGTPAGAIPIPPSNTSTTSEAWGRADGGLDVRFGKGKNRCSKAQNRGV
ncbi:MAG: hypothetical protein UC300_04130 [Prevotella sp.]|nr:hypothetical protein [Prevotella sp.]